MNSGEEIFSAATEDQRRWRMDLSRGEIRLLTRLIVKANYTGSEVVRAATLLTRFGELRKMSEAGVAAQELKPAELTAAAATASGPKWIDVEPEPPFAGIGGPSNAT